MQRRRARRRLRRLLGPCDQRISRSEVYSSGGWTKPPEKSLPVRSSTAWGESPDDGG